MAVKDKVVTWFFLHYVMPRAQIIDKPGFVVFKVSHKTDIYSRQVVMPEPLYVSIEKHFSSKFGKQGRQALYSVGKKFGYRFASVSHAMRKKDVDEKPFLGYVNLLAKFVEGTYASKMTYNLDLPKSSITFGLENFVICRKSGIGYLFSVAGIAGIWSFMNSDPKIEAIQPKCQGRGDVECQVTAAPSVSLKGKGQEVLSETNLEGLGLDPKYKIINEIRPVAHAKNSLKSMIDTRFFEFHNGILTFKDHRYFIVEASLNYLLEKELKKLKGGKEDLFKLSFEYGKSLTSGQDIKDACKFVTEFISALGWGDVHAKDQNGTHIIRAVHFPWTKWSKDCDYVLFRGMLSGILSGVSGKQVKLTKIKQHVSMAGLSLILTE
jgi:hypothetical protein